MVTIIFEIWKYGPVVKGMKIIFQDSSNDIRSYVTGNINALLVSLNDTIDFN